MNSAVLNYLGLITLAAVVAGAVLAAIGIPPTNWAWVPTTVATGVGALSGVAMQAKQKSSDTEEPA